MDDPPPLGGGPAFRLLRDSTIYLFGNVLQKATAFVLIPVYTKHLAPAQYGLLELAGTLVGLLLVVAALRVPDAINKCFHRDCRDGASRGRLGATALLFTVASAGTLAIAGWAFERPLAQILFPGPDGLLLLRYTLVTLLLSEIAVVPFELLRADGRARLYVALSLVQLGVQTAAVVGLVAWGGYGLKGVLAGNLLGLVAVNLVAAGAILPRLVWRFDPRLLAALLRYGLAMLPVFVCGWIVNLSDRFFIQHMVGLAALGVYALGYKFGALVNLLLVVPFQRAWTPLFFRMGDAREAPAHLARVLTYLTLAAAGASLAISLATPPFLRLAAAPGYRDAALIVPVVCLGYLLNGIANCLGNGLVIANRLRLIALNALVPAAANLLLNFLLIPPFGIMGAAWATVLSFGLQCVVVRRSLRRHYPVRLERRRLLGIVAAAAAPLLASAALPALPPAADLAARAALFLLFPALLLALRIADAGEIAAARTALAALRRLPGRRRAPRDRAAGG